MDTLKRFPPLFFVVCFFWLNISLADEGIEPNKGGRITGTNSKVASINLDMINKDERIIWLRQPRAVYPSRMLDDPGCGFVDLKFDVSSEEEIVNISVEESSHKEFDRNAIRALRGAKVRIRDSALMDEGIQSLSIRIVFENLDACGAKSMRPKDPEADVSYCLAVFSERQKSIVYQSGGMNSGQFPPSTVVNVRLINRCGFSVRALVCYSYLVGKKKTRSRCKKELVLGPQKIKGIGKINKMLSKKLTLGYNSVACVAKESKKDDFVAPRLVYQVNTNEETKVKSVTGRCEI